MVRALAGIILGIGLIIGAVVGVAAIKHHDAGADAQTHILLTKQSGGGYRLDWSLAQNEAVVIRLQRPDGQCDLYVDEQAGHKIWQVDAGIGVWSRLTSPDHVEESLTEAGQDCSSTTVYQTVPQGVNQ